MGCADDSLLSLFSMVAPRWLADFNIDTLDTKLFAEVISAEMVEALGVVPSSGFTQSADLDSLPGMTGPGWVNAGFKATGVSLKHYPLTEPRSGAP